MTVKKDVQTNVQALTFINVPVVSRFRATHVNHMQTAKLNAQLLMMVLSAKKELSGARMDQSVHAMLVHKAVRTMALSATINPTMYSV